MRLFASVAFLLSLTLNTAEAKETALRAAIIGGMQMSGMWERVAAAFEKRHGIKVEMVVSGNKKVLDEYVREHQVDFITMHSSDTISNLAADGLFEQLTPWARNSQMIVGAKENPAKLTLKMSLKEALNAIEKSDSTFVFYPSTGTLSVIHALEERYDFKPKVHYLKSKRGFLKEVLTERGYTLFGVIPFLMQKHSHAKIEGFYIEDAALQRPFLAAIAPASKISQARHEDAQKLLRFLRSKEAQKIVAASRLKGFEHYPIFYPVTIEE